MTSGRNLYLVGPMGVGKTTIGKLVARKLGREFVDLDEELERRAGAAIAWIFDVEGEEGFRKREAELLREYSERTDMVVSTGGGIVLNATNRHILAATGLVIHLDASVEQLHERTLKDRKRPLLQVADRRGAIAELKAARDPLYREVADLHCDVGRRSSRRVADSLCRQIDGAC